MVQKKTILYIEDEIIDQISFERFMKSINLPFKYDIVKSIDEAKEFLKVNGVDIVLSDFHLGDGTALDIIEFLNGTPIVIITATGDELLAVKSMKAGAYDYLIKDLDNNYLMMLPTTLENAIKQRRVELDLKKAQQAAELANKTKDEFLANMSHEIRTPLTAIIGYSEILEESDLDANGRKSALQAITNSCNHLLEIINDILDIAKIESGMICIEESEFSLLKVLDEVLALAIPRAKLKSLELKVLASDLMPKLIVGDPTRLKQILINLVHNAIKFTDSGKVTIEIHSQQQNNQLIFKVIDTGIGISPEDIPKLFKQFSQADSTITRNYGGTGLGLAIADRLASLMSGKISVTSTLGEGSTFELVIPIKIPQTSKDSSVEKIRVDENAIEPKMIAGKILVVDDNLESRKLLELFFRKTRAEITFAENGKQALELIAQQSFDLILLDIQMPIMDGKTTVIEMRHRGVLTPVIALTANTMKHEVDSYFKIGCNAFLGKPFKKKELYSVLFANLN